MIYIAVSREVVILAPVLYAGIQTSCYAVDLLDVRLRYFALQTITRFVNAQTTQDDVSP
jgi:hypothetical protein